jgi:transcriptional regulator with XRE-family HTH domain
MWNDDGGAVTRKDPKATSSHSSSTKPRKKNGTVDPEALRVGTRIREIRQSQGVSLKQLAAASGVTHSFLSLVERGLARASWTTFKRITDTLGVSQGQLLLSTETDAPPAGADGGPVVSRAVDGAGQLEFVGRQEFNLAGAFNGSLRAFVTVGVLNEADRFDSHRGDEFVYVVRGTLRIEFEGGETQILATGDAIHYPATVPHLWGAVDDDGYTVFSFRSQTEENPGLHR